MQAPSDDADALLALLGQPADDAAVQQVLQSLAHGMQPELDPDDPEDFVDWVTVNEIGLEFGFIDEAYLRALEIERRRAGPLLLAQLYFYGDTPKTRRYPWALPFGLSFADDAAAVRRRMHAHEASRRSADRDAWSLPAFDVTTAYRRNDGLLESVYCHLRFAPWPALAEETVALRSYPPAAFVELLGLRWSSAELRARLGPLGYGEILSEVRGRHVADLRLAHGISLEFAPGDQVGAPHPELPRSLSLAKVTFYGSREEDARQWAGPLPFDLAFSDSQAVLERKIGRPADHRSDGDRVGIAAWHFPDHTLSVVYSNIENRLLSMSVQAPLFWRVTHAKDTG